MGWKLIGITIDKNFEKDLTELFNLFELEQFELEKESTFEDETENYLEDENISIGFFEKGTYLSTGVELATNYELLKNASTNYKILAFYINDITNTYCFDYFSKGEYTRRKWISHSDKNIDSSENFGELLDVEKDEDDDLEIIFSLISTTLNKDFYEIEEDDQMFRFVKTKAKKVVNAKLKKKGIWKKLFG